MWPEYEEHLLVVVEMVIITKDEITSVAGIFLIFKTHIIIGPYGSNQLHRMHNSQEALC